jgi:hypothetical protein
VKRKRKGKREKLKEKEKREGNKEKRIGKGLNNYD